MNKVSAIETSYAKMQIERRVNCKADQIFNGLRKLLNCYNMQ